MTNSLVSTNVDLRDIRPPVEIPSGWEWLWWVAGAAFLLGIAWLAWQLWRRRKVTVQAVPLIPPHVRAKARLQDALRLIAEPKPFCFEVSDILRLYLEERFEFSAPERTTEEFLYELQGTNLLLLDQKTSLGEFLQRCDLVKFARYEPGEPELRELHASALRLIAETEPQPPTVETAESQSQSRP